MAFRGYWLLLFLYLPFCNYAQDNPLQLEISGTFHNRPVMDILHHIEQHYPVRFFYYPDQMPVYRQSLQFNREPLISVLEELLGGTQLAYIHYGTDRVVILPKPRLKQADADQLIAEWESGTIKPPVTAEARQIRRTFGDTTLQVTDQTFVLKGTLTDSRDGTPIIGAGIGQPGTQFGTSTDFEGRFQLELPAGRHQLQIQYIGYQPILLELGLYEDAQVDLAMETQALALDEIVVSAEVDNRRVTSAQIGVQELSPKTIKDVPALLGEADVVKSLILLPGVSTVGEGAGGFNVRGGNIDQNLVLMDGVPIYNSAHALGFFSIFNTDAVRNVTLYKGNIPAQYGGRTSSVLDVDLRSGDFEEFHGQGGVGMITSRLLLEGPLWKERLSILAGGRISYPDYLLRRVQDPDVNSSSARFHDLTGKLSARLWKGNTIELSGFWSADYFRFADEFGYEWENKLANLEWKQLYREGLSSTLAFSLGDYSNRQFDPEGSDAFSLYGGLRYYKGKGEVVFSPDKTHFFRAGAEWLYQDTQDERREPLNSSSAVAERQVPKGQGHEFGIFINDEWTISPRISASLGLRYSWFSNVGPATVYSYEPGIPPSPSTVADSTDYASGEKIATYSGWEPRLSVKYGLNPESSIKASYNRLYQYIHLISNTTATTPIDIWQVSSPDVRPQIADNFSVGYFRNFAANSWEFSIEGYYRLMQHIVEYKDLADLFLNEHLETELLPADGRAYGLELSMRKKIGKWTGWLSYTYARTFVKVDGAYDATTVNGGNWYAANIDQPQQVSLYNKWQLKPKHFFTVNFLYHSGRPVTAPVGGYLLGETYVPHYSDRNALRIPDYHRLDIAYTFDNSEGKSKGFRGSFTIAVYNLYARQNAYSVFFKRDDGTDIPQAFQLAVLGTAVPSITFNFIF